jgi:hypothetical protein
MCGAPANKWRRRSCSYSSPFMTTAMGLLASTSPPSSLSTSTRVTASGAPLREHPHRGRECDAFGQRRDNALGDLLRHGALVDKRKVAAARQAVSLL